MILLNFSQMMSIFAKQSSTINCYYILSCYQFVFFYAIYLLSVYKLFFFFSSLFIIICSVCFETFVYNAICYVCGTRQSYIIFETVYMLEESPCSICGKQVNTDGVFCNSCNLWVHPDCHHLGEVEFKILIDSDDFEPWSCIKCNLNALNYYQS